MSGYRGVWVNQAGKHFVKINGKRLTDDNGKEMLFPGVEEAAKKHDEYLKSTNPKGKVEYNYKPDGTRVVYEDVSTSSTTGIGGGAASVVPALSVINIKVRPPIGLFVTTNRRNHCPDMSYNYRIFPLMSNHCFVIRDKPLGRGVTPRGMSMPIGVFAGKPERDTIDGKVKFHSWE